MSDDPTQAPERIPLAFGEPTAELKLDPEQGAVTHPDLPDYSTFASAQLIDDLARLQRYEERFVKAFGRAAYTTRLDSIRTVLQERGVDPNAAAPAPEPPPPRAACRLQPLADCVVVIPDTAAETTAGGLIVVDSAKEKPQTGEVWAVGPGKATPSGSLVPAVQVGQTVLFGRYAGAELTLDDVAVLVMREDDILGILGPKA